MEQVSPLSRTPLGQSPEDDFGPHSAQSNKAAEGKADKLEPAILLKKLLASLGIRSGKDILTIGNGRQGSQVVTVDAITAQAGKKEGATAEREKEEKKDAPTGSGAKIEGKVESAGRGTFDLTAFKARLLRDSLHFRFEEPDSYEKSENPQETLLLETLNSFTIYNATMKGYLLALVQQLYEHSVQIYENFYLPKSTAGSEDSYKKFIRLRERVAKLLLKAALGEDPVKVVLGGGEESQHALDYAQTKFCKCLAADTASWANTVSSIYAAYREDIRQFLRLQSSGDIGELRKKMRACFQAVAKKTWDKRKNPSSHGTDEHGEDHDTKLFGEIAAKYEAEVRDFTYVFMGYPAAKEASDQAERRIFQSSQVLSADLAGTPGSVLAPIQENLARKLTAFWNTPHESSIALIPLAGIIAEFNNVAKEVAKVESDFAPRISIRQLNKMWEEYLDDCKTYFMGNTNPKFRRAKKTALWMVFIGIVVPAALIGIMYGSHTLTAQNFHEYGDMLGGLTAAWGTLILILGKLYYNYLTQNHDFEPEQELMQESVRLFKAAKKEHKWNEPAEEWLAAFVPVLEGR